MKDLFNREIETGEQLVERLKEEYKSKGANTQFMYPYILGQMKVYYDNMKLQLEMSNEKSKRNLTG